jgi:hypothetical protein
MRRVLGLALAIVLGFVAAGRAAPLDLKQVSGDAKWVVHVDFDAVRASKLFEKAWKSAAERFPDAEAQLGMLKAMWNFDPSTDLHGVTIYGTQFKRDTGVAIINVKIDPDVLIEAVKLAPDYRTSTYGKHEIHSWLHAKGAPWERTFAGVVLKPDVLVLGASIEEVMAAIDVSEGKMAGAVEKAAMVGGAIPAGAIVVAGAAGLADAKLPVQWPAAKQAESLTLVVGEDKNEVFVQGKLVVKDAEAAQHAKALADKALAAATLVHHEREELLKLIGAVKVSAADKAVNIAGRAPVEAVWAAIEKAH